MDILELIESIEVEKASLRTLFGSEGTGIRHSPRQDNYLTRLTETAKFMADILEGRRPVHQLQEAMTTSDFPLLFGDVLDRQVLANYREHPATWRMYAKRSVVPDFRLVSRFAVSGAEATLPVVPEKTEYPAAALAESRTQYSVKKYGRRIPMSWETNINNDLDAISDFPARLGKAARRSEDKFATELHVGTAGPHGTHYTSGKGNIVTGNPVLNIEGLQTAFTVLGNMKDDDDEPIVIDMVVLEVPPALEVVARNILNATEIWVNASGGGSAEQQLNTVNWMRNRVSLAVNPYIPIVASASNGSTTWFLHGSTEGGRPAMELGFLRGHTEPEIFVKEPNARRVGGGGPVMGDFDTDAIDYKVRHVFGGVFLDSKMSVASNGSGA